MSSPTQYFLFRSLHDLASDDHLVQYRVDHVEVEDEVQFLDFTEVVVEDFDEELDELQVGKLAVVDVNTDGDEQGFETRIQQSTSSRNY